MNTRVLHSVVIPLALLGTALAEPSLSAQTGPPEHVVYVQSNSPLPGGNAVFAWRQDPADGSLTPLPGSPFLTGGTGSENPDQLLGPNDSDGEVIVSAEKHLLFTVNSGSNTIAIMRIHADGSLEPVHGSPFDSGGIMPVSLALSGRRLYVANKNQDPSQPPNMEAPNYVGFTVSKSGALKRLPRALQPVGLGSSPTQVPTSPDGRLLFGSDLFAFPFDNGPMLPPFGSDIRPFRIMGSGALNPQPPTVLPSGPPPLVLGLAMHPVEPILYAGVVAGNALAVYTYDRDGALRFVGSSPNGGAAICWILVSPDGRRAWTTNTGDATVSTYDLTDPLDRWRSRCSRSRRKARPRRPACRTRSRADRSSSRSIPRGASSTS